MCARYSLTKDQITLMNCEVAFDNRTASFLRRCFDPTPKKGRAKIARV